MARSRRRALVMLLSSAAISGAVAMACQVFVPIDDHIPSSAEAGLEPESGSEVPGACGLLPLRPDAGPPGASTPIVFAAVDWAFESPGTESHCPNAGFDLDNVNTQEPNACEQNRSCAPR